MTPRLRKPFDKISNLCANFVHLKFINKLIRRIAVTLSPEIMDISVLNYIELNVILYVLDLLVI